MTIPTELYGNTLRAWLIALGIVLVTYLVLRLAHGLITRRLTMLSRRTSTTWDDAVAAALGKTSSLFLLVIGLLAGTSALALTDRAMAGLQTLAVLAFLIQAGVWITVVARTLLGRYQQAHLETDRSAATTVGAMTFLLQMVVWTGVLLLALDNLGVDVTALIAGLGVGGIAVALAAQNILGDLFASLAIVLDKPFVLKDFIIVDNYLGTVDHIGLKTTRLRSLSGEQLIFSNADLLKSRIRNYGRMYERRVVFTIRATYQTPGEQVAKIPGIIREAIEAQPRTRFDRSHFFNYGEYGLEFESVYYVLSPDYNVYADIQQAINLRIHARFEEEGIDFAVPEQRVYLERRPLATA